MNRERDQHSHPSRSLGVDPRLPLVAAAAGFGFLFNPDRLEQHGRQITDPMKFAGRSDFSGSFPKIRLADLAACATLNLAG